MFKRANTYLLIALGIGLVFHGSAVFFTLERTYDALIHLFFSEHYANNWFEPWNYKWYTGYIMVSYPPCAHQLLAVFSFIGGFRFALYFLAFVVIVLFITGSYRYSLVITKNENYAGFASIFAVFSSTFIETLHLYGQLPTLLGISLLLHCLPEVYSWIITKKLQHLIASLLLIGFTVTSHHVTPIFGMVFFILPMIGLGLMDLTKKRVGSYKAIRLKHLITELFASLKSIILFGGGSLVIMVFWILPYWINTKKNPITQVPIPHGSRDNYLEVMSSGLVFFLIPYGVLLLMFPYLYYRFFSRRLIFFGLSFAMLVILGTGGTTPLAKMILGDNAFNILTLDRFTFWASMMSLPIVGEFFYRLFKTDYKTLLINRVGRKYYVFCCTIIGITAAFFAGFTTTLSRFRPTQPPKIKLLPMLNFLNADKHYKWRYLTLGFGDQMAWLGLNTKALSVDGNYNSARALPELTTKAVERLENCKFRGVEGIGSLQQFLTHPGKYNLKYIFSNDKFYDPILYFTGWQRLVPLDNGIMVWEKLNVKPLPDVIPNKTVSDIERLMWGIIPMTTVSLTIIFFGFTFFTRKLPIYEVQEYNKFPQGVSRVMLFWNIGVFFVCCYGFHLFYIKNVTQHSATNVVKAYYDAMDFKEFERAHSYLLEETGKTLDQFMLEISVTDGILSSYAKLDEIKTEILYEQYDSVQLRASSKWITPLEIVKHEEILTSVRRKGKWYIIPTILNPELPQNQFFKTNTTSYYNQGRRRISTQETYHEDILPQPVLKINEARLIERDSQFHVIGELQNIDHFPADITLKAILYDEDNIELATYSSKLESKHKLNPMEISSFKIDFEETAWLSINDKASGTFDPHEFHIKKFDRPPKSFVLHVSSTVATVDLYQNIHFHQTRVKPDSINGQLFNAGNKEVTIPELLASYYRNDTLLWVDHHFIGESVRPHRKGPFTYLPKPIEGIKIIDQGTENTYVNGVQNQDITVDRLDYYYPEHLKRDIMKLNDSIDIRLELYNYIGKL